MGEYLIVRQSDAHAWTEIWADGSGWIRVDPTAAVAPERIDSGISGVMFNEIGASWGLTSTSLLLHEMTLAWDAMNAKWNEWILAYGPENQNLLMQWLGMDDPSWRQMILTLLVIIALMVAAISILLVLRYRPPVRDEAALLFQKFIRRVGTGPDTGETPLAFGDRIRNSNAEIADDADDVIHQYLVTRYGPENPESVDALRRSVDRFAAR